MKNRQIRIFYSMGVVQILGLGVLFYNWWIGVAMFAVCACFQIGYATSIVFQHGKMKVCPECKASIPKYNRICPECGHLYQKGVSEEELTGIIEKEKEEQMSSQQIDCDFEMIEEIAVEEMTSFDGDIEALLKKKDGVEI